jgi:hypothetical protein
VASLRLVALAALEDLFVCQLAQNGISQEARDAFKQYKKVLAHALGPVSSVASSTQQAGTRNEQSTALRLAIIALVKLTV